MLPAARSAFEAAPQAWQEVALRRGRTARSAPPPRAARPLGSGARWWAPEAEAVGRGGNDGGSAVVDAAADAHADAQCDAEPDAQPALPDNQLDELEGEERELLPTSFLGDVGEDVEEEEDGADEDVEDEHGDAATMAKWRPCGVSRLAVLRGHVGVAVLLDLEAQHEELKAAVRHQRKARLKERLWRQ